MFAMFTPAGNAAVAAIVEMAIERCYSYTNLEKALYKLAEIECFAEASDTAVRECAFVALRESFETDVETYKKNVEFWRKANFVF